MALGAACHGKTDPIKVREAVLLTPLCWETALLGDVKNRLNMWRQILPRLRLAREDDVCRGYRAGTRLIYGLIFLNSLFVPNTLINFHFDQLIVINVSFMTHCTDTKALLFFSIVFEGEVSRSYRRGAIQLGYGRATSSQRSGHFKRSWTQRRKGLYEVVSPKLFTVTNLGACSTCLIQRY